MISSFTKNVERLIHFLSAIGISIYILLIALQLLDFKNASYSLLN